MVQFAQWFYFGCTKQRNSGLVYNQHARTYLFLELGHHDFVDIVDALLGRPVVRDLARLDVLLREEVVEGANVLRHLGRTDKDHKVINLCPIQARAKKSKDKFDNFLVCL